MKTRIHLHILLMLALLFAPAIARARYYQPETGRFITMDSYEGDQQQPASLHKYAYCQGNPVNGTDPSGHEFSGSVSELMLTIGIEKQIRAIGEGAAIHAFRQGAIRGISGAILKSGAVGILGLTAGGVAGQVAYLSGAIGSNPAALASPQTRRQLRIQVESEEENRSTRILFHYTGAAEAQKILQDRSITSSERKRFGGFTFPPGAYASDVPPWSTSYTRHQLSALFYGGNEKKDMSWCVLVEEPGFRPLNYPGFPHQYVYEWPPGGEVPATIVGAFPNLMSP